MLYCLELFVHHRALSHKLESLSSLKDKPATMWLNKAQAALEDEKDTMWSCNEIEHERVCGFTSEFAAQGFLQDAIGRQKKGLPQRGGLNSTLTGFRTLLSLSCGPE